MKIGATPRGHDEFLCDDATVASLAKLLNPSVPYVWIFHHMPTPIVQWWDADVPINKCERLSAKVRMLSYDLQMSTSEFLQRSLAFEGHAIDLVQADRPMPDTLDLSRIPAEQQDDILFRNGAFLRISLPHANETASVVCYQPGYLAKVESCASLRNVRPRNRDHSGNRRTRPQAVFAAKKLPHRGH
jgi:hypothetical protein